MSKLDRYLKRLAPHAVLVWSSVMIAVLACGLALKGRFIGLGVGVGIGVVRYAFSQSDYLKAFRSNYKIPNWVHIVVGLITPAVIIGMLFYSLNLLPWIGDVAFRNYRGIWVLSIAVIGLGFLILNETDRPNKYMLPLIIMSGLALIGFGVSTVDYDYLLLVLMMAMGLIMMWEWWFAPHLYMKEVGRAALVLALPVTVFTCAQVSSQILLRIMFPSGLLMQYFFALPGLFIGVFVAMYIVRFQFRKSLWIVAPLVPVIVALILGVEAGMCYWLSFSFTLFVLSLMDATKVYLVSGISIATTILLYLFLPVVHIPFNVMSADLRSAFGVSIVVFWLIITLFGNQVRRDWSLEHLAKNRIKQRRFKFKK
ncbi:hypothetical protein EBR57_02010 [bacterium]|nr:hypothetical protein [bacterium]